MESEKWEFIYIMFYGSEVNKYWDEISSALGPNPRFKIDSPIVQIALYLLNAINQDNGLKLTGNGNLPQKIVSVVQSLEFFKTNIFGWSRWRSRLSSIHFPINLILLEFRRVFTTRWNSKKLSIRIGCHQ